MKRYLALTALLAACAPAAKPLPPLASDAVIDAAERAPEDEWTKNGEWNVPMAPFTVIGNVHYVGTKTVSAWLITSRKGHILIDGIVAQSVPQILANVKTLGFNIRDVKYLLNSHAHFDHAGGLAGLKRASGAIMVASAADKPALEDGDIGHGPSGGIKFPPVRVDRVIGEGGKVTVGGNVLTAHMTPGHSPGCTSWSMTAKDKGGKPRSIFFNCSETVAGQTLVPEAYPGIVANFRKTFAKIKTLKADIFLSNHENFFDLHEKRAKLMAGDANAFVNPDELRQFNADMEEAFEEKLKEQMVAKAP